jgi:beta-galactosidase
MTTRRSLAALATLLFALTLSAVHADPAWVWIEGENPAATPTITPPKGKPDDRGFVMAGWGSTEFISEGKLLSISIPADQAADRLGPDGAVFAYEFNVENPGEYALWARIGMEWVRSPFDWKLDAGPWTLLPHLEPTIDVVPLQRWNELAWIQLGKARLDKGKHTLSFRHKPYTVKDNKGNEKPGRILHMLDALCIYQGEFRPNGHRKPGADYKSEKDTKAAETVFELNDDGSHRPAVVLDGLWETARWDERIYDPATRLQGPTELPDLSRLYWFGIDVPHGNRNSQIPEHSFSHRFLLRTRVKVPADMAGRGFVLEFEGVRMIASVFVNGRFCGWTRAFDAPWHCDLTGAVKPGALNEIVVAVKTEHYAIVPERQTGDRAEELGLRGPVNIPWDMRDHQSMGQFYDMPVASHLGSGIRETLRLVAVGETWVEDVFAKPSFKNKKLDLELTLKNGGAQDAPVTVTNEVRRWSPEGLAGKPDIAFPTRQVNVAAGKMASLDLSVAWPTPALWFPDDPNLYTVVTTVKDAAGKLVDTRHTRFGFREITWDGGGFYINGVPWQFWADIDNRGSVDGFIKKAHESGQNYFRFWNGNGWKASPREVCDALDEAGVMFRDSGVFDGQMANYGQGLCQGGRDDRTYYRPLFEHTAEQARAWVRGRRNHPSILFWTFENEITYINSANLGMSQYVEPGIRWIAEEIMKVDPTRPAAIDGGRALRPPEEWKNAPPEVVKLGHLPINGAHYNENSGGVTLRDYPDAAYTNKHWLEHRHRGLWPMLADRPITHGEIFFANGYQPSQLSLLGGESCFIGPSEAWPARDLMLRFLYEGMRWSNSSHAMHSWTGRSTRNYYHAWSPVAVFVREWDRCFGSGRTVTRTLKVLNSTSKDTPIQADWKIVVDGRDLAAGSRTFKLAPGGKSDPFTVELAMPKVDALTPAQLVLTARRGGKEVFREAKPITIIAAAAAPKPDLPKADLVVLDPSGETKARLAERGVAFTEIAAVDQIKLRPQALIIGRNAVPKDRVADPFWQKLLMAGARVVVLEQDNPLRYQALPADFDLSPHAGSIAFGEDFSHPALVGLNQDALFCWHTPDGHRTYRGAYRKATKGARSLVQCDEELGFTALAECRLQNGTMLLCQLLVGETLAANPVAQRLFDNMVAYAASYKPVTRSTVAVLPENDLRAKLLQAVQLDFSRAGDPLQALASGKDIAIVDASPANLAALKKAKDKVDAFTAGGGWLVLWGVTPEGLKDFNALVGVDHVMRPFLREKVVLAVPKDPLTAGLTLRDVAMDTGETPMRFWNVPWAVNDAYTFVVDLRDIAPFLDFPGRDGWIKKAKEGPQHQGNPLNMFNGFTGAQWWQYLWYIDFEGDSWDMTFNLPKKEKLLKLSIVPNNHLWQPRTVKLYPDDAPEPVSLPLEVGAFQQDFDLGGVEAAKLKLVLTDFENTNPDRPQSITGIETLAILAERSPEWDKKVRPLLNVGGLVAYDLGKGGILLNQLNIKERELNPTTVEKKRNIVKTVLGNLGAVVGGTRPVVVGTGLEVQPVPIKDDTFNAYNQHKNQPPWFTDRAAREADLSRLPEGPNKFDGVLFEVPEFQTSVVPSVIMLKGDGNRIKDTEVTGIAVGRKADALFFLHTYNAGRNLNAWQRNVERGRADPAEPPVLFRYRVNYADGQSVEVPVRWNEGVSHWVQKDPKPLRYAAVAWAAPAKGAKDKALQTTVYSMQWNNPRADVAVKSIDILPSPERNGVALGAPAVIAISTARAPQK